MKKIKAFVHHVRSAAVAEAEAVIDLIRKAGKVGTVLPVDGTR